MKLHANARTCSHCRSLIVSRVTDDGADTLILSGSKLGSTSPDRRHRYTGALTEFLQANAGYGVPLCKP